MYIVRYDTTSLFCIILFIISLASFISFSLICLLDSFLDTCSSPDASLILASKESISSALSVGSILIENIAPILPTKFPSHFNSTFDG